MTGVIFPPNCSKFFYETGISNLILTNSDTSHVTNMSKMFVDCTGLTSLNLSSWDTSNVLNMVAMFGNDVNLRSITYGSKFVHNTNANVVAMFGGWLPETPDVGADYQYEWYQDCPANRPNTSTWNGVDYL